MPARWRVILAVVKREAALRRLAADGTSAPARLGCADVPSAAKRANHAIARAAILVLLCCRPLAAQERLFEQEPFDQITLTKVNQSAVLKVKPLELPGRRLPEPLPRRGTIQVRLMDDPRKLYEVAWQAIEKVELFEQSVLREAEALVAAKQFDLAYDCFKFLEEEYPKVPGLDEAIEEFLFQEAGSLYLEKQYDGALALLRELHRRNPQRPKLERVLGTTTEKLVDKYLAKEDYRSARTLLGNLGAWFPEHPVVVQRQGQLRQLSAGLLAEARSAMQEGDLRKAAQLADRAVGVWPELPGAKELAKSIYQEYPRVVVGVNLPAADIRPGGLNDWAARRSARLIYRTLTEYMGPGSEGGRYSCPVGEMTIEALDRRLTLLIKPNLRWSSGEATLTGYDVSRRLLALADPRDAAYRAGWAELLGGVAVDGVYQVDVEMRLAHVRPDAFLQTILVPYTTLPAASSRPPPTNGPYVIGPRTDGQTCYLANGHYFAARPTQPKEIVERRYARGSKAIQALKDGRIDVLDRLNPWSLDAVRRDQNLVVEPYAMPLVHCLIPNMRRPLTAHRAFRRALVYGIHRQVILDQLTGGVKVPGCQVLSGPFPTRLSFDDPISYARDPSIDPRVYDPRLAIALAEVSRKELAATQGKQEDRQAKTPPLVLAHPPHDLARLACTSIQRQLELVGVPIELRELGDTAPAQIPQDVDLLYAELAIWEPLADAARLLGEDGLTAACSPYMGLALGQLQRTADWQQIRQILHRIHRIAHDEVAIVPLWQLTEHFAYRRGLQGVGSRPVSLYQNVEQWQGAFRYPPE